MRLIDADLSKVMFMQRARLVHYGFADRLCVPYDAVDEVPTVGDAVLVVRCRECKWYREGEKLAPTKFCFRLQHPTENRQIGYNFADDDYCSYGEREDGSEDI